MMTLRSLTENDHHSHAYQGTLWRSGNQPAVGQAFSLTAVCASNLAPKKMAQIAGARVLAGTPKQTREAASLSAWIG